ncbi:MAG: hypothetical protein RL026_2241 [Pseudomonadota bacterium]
MSGESLTLHCVVLAAGAARRFGSPKQLARHGGRSLLQAAVERAQAVAGPAVTVVVGAHAAQVVPSLGPTTARILLNRQWDEGIGSSIRAAALAVDGHCDGVLLTLADQAALRVEDLQRLVAAWRADGQHIVAARYGGTSGAPVLFPAWCLPALASCRGESGAQRVLRAYPDKVIHVPLQRAALDVDRPEDLIAVEREIGLGVDGDTGAQGHPAGGIAEL